MGVWKRTRRTRWAYRAIAATALVCAGCGATRSPSAPAATVGPPPPLTTEVEVTPLAQARDLERRGRLYEAAQVLSDAIQEEDDPDLRQSRAELYAQMGYLRSAEADLEKVLDVDRSRVRAWVRLGQVRLELERFAAAAEAFEVARILRPDDSSLLVFNARACRGTGDVDAAGELYFRALDAGEHGSAFLCELASLSLSLGERVFERRGLDPLELVDDAIEGQPYHAKGWFVRGVLLEARDLFAEAAAAYERATELEPDSLDAWTNLALVCRTLGDEQRAVAAANRALELEPASDRQERLQRLAGR